MSKEISGFSKLNKEQKLSWVTDHFCQGAEEARGVLRGFWHSNTDLQNVVDGFSENTLSNFVVPYGVAPNFIIDGKAHCVPMAIEESSVVAAASSAAKFWQTRGGFRTEILGTEKIGQVHFTWSGSKGVLSELMTDIESVLRAETAHLTANMEKRGGGISSIDLLEMTDLETDYYQLQVRFETCDSMGANFINSVLEEFGKVLTHYTKERTGQATHIIMAILSNYTPNCVVRAWVECPIESFGGHGSSTGAEMAEKFKKAIHIARIDPYRAVTHNKGIFNGIDAVVLATANDFRAVEACGHAYACRDGQYRSLSRCSIVDGIFKFWLDIPLAVGTVGGLTSVHPLAKLSLEILGKPSATELMSIIAATGLAQNFAAVRSLVTSGIQQGHMKMHLGNILNHLGATEQEKGLCVEHFKDKVVSFTGIRMFLGK
jgi:hydroxymethylglutaryl-CoA reductase